MNNVLKNRYIMQKANWAILIISTLSILYLITNINPNGKMYIMLGLDATLITFLASLSYTCLELYISLIKKEILEAGQAWRAWIACVMSSINTVGALVLYQSNNLNYFTIIVTTVIFLIIYFYAFTN
jgi:hypothetical protein